MAGINFSKIEKKWQDKWEKAKIFEVKEESKKPKYYVLEQFPYPSGSGLHVGHAFVYTIGDIYARFKRMKGFNVLYPTGYDSLGLPAENAAIKEGVHPKKYTDNAVKYFSKQQKSIGLSYDWSRMFWTHDSEYYKWDQWIFLKMLEKGLVYQKKSPVNFCKKCNTVLANEQVHDGKCWRHEDTNVEIKHLNQWYLKITDYAEELADFSSIEEWPDLIKKLQKNWIGKSHGTEIMFEIENSDKKEIEIEDVESFRKSLNINSKLRIKNKEFFIKQIVKFRLDDGSYYMKLFLNEDYVLADDSKLNSFIFVKESKANLKIKESDVDFKNKKFRFSYKAHAVAEEVDGEEIFAKGESESFWDYESKDGSYLSLGIVDKTNKRLDFVGKIISLEDIKILFKDNEKWPIFTTRPDTIYGVTFMVISSQHPRLMKLVSDKQKKEVEKFVKKLSSVSQEDIDKLDKEGVFTGSYAVNPVNNEKVPVYAGNFVLADYGCGMVMAVPAHDQRDFEFAKKYNVPVRVVIQPEGYEINVKKMSRAYVGDGGLVDSGDFNGWNNRNAIDAITEFLKKKKLGKKTIQYRLKDWLISRQRYWGTPIPIIHCKKCGVVPVNEKDLPVKLPEKVKFGKGNPLESAEVWIKVKCPKCGDEGRRETDTMDTFANSSWYDLRYCDSKNNKKIFDSVKANYWTPIDIYIGGKEHACMHDIYIRFYHKFLRDLGLLNSDEPAKKLFVQGFVNGEDGNKMSKSRPEYIVDPMDMIKKYGADSLRLFLVSVASPDSDFNWSDKGIQGSNRFVDKFFNFIEKLKIGKSSKRLESKINQGIKEISDYIENFKYNLSVIKLRALFDVFVEEKEANKKDLESFLKLLSVFCPHVCEELWEKIRGKGFISLADWPVADEKKIDKELEKQEQIVESVVGDIMNILRILKEKQGKECEKVYLYVMPNEIGIYDGERLSNRIGKKLDVFAVNDKNKYDPSGKAKKAKPGKPGIFVE